MWSESRYNRRPFGHCLDTSVNYSLEKLLISNAIARICADLKRWGADIKQIKPLSLAVTGLSVLNNNDDNNNNTRFFSIELFLLLPF